MQGIEAAFPMADGGKTPRRSSARSALLSGASVTGLSVALAAALLTAPAPAQAADIHFIAPGTAPFNNIATWSGGVTPTAVDRVIFDRAGTGAVSLIPSGRTVGQLVFLAPYSSPGFVTSPISSLITIGGLAGLGIDNQVDQQITLSGRVAIGADQEWRISSAGGSIYQLSTVATPVLSLGGSMLTLNGINAANYFQFDNLVSGTGGLTTTGLGTTILNGTNTYTGGTFLNGGVLSVSSDGNLGGAAGDLSFDGGVLRVTGTAFASTARTLNWGAGGGGFDIADAGGAFTVGQVLSGGGGLTKLGVGALTLTGANT